MIIQPSSDNTSLTHLPTHTQLLELRYLLQRHYTYFSIFIEYFPTNFTLWLPLADSNTTREFALND